MEVAEKVRRGPSGAGAQPQGENADLQALAQVLSADYCQVSRALSSPWKGV